MTSENHHAISVLRKRSFVRQLDRGLIKRAFFAVQFGCQIHLNDNGSKQQFFITRFREDFCDNANSGLAGALL
jgi:hypothetical protein